MNGKKASSDEPNYFSFFGTNQPPEWMVKIARQPHQLKMWTKYRGNPVDGDELVRQLPAFTPSYGKLWRAPGVADKNPDGVHYTVPLVGYTEERIAAVYKPGFEKLVALAIRNGGIY